MAVHDQIWVAVAVDIGPGRARDHEIGQARFFAQLRGFGSVLGRALADRHRHGERSK
jgi:hypothetical protein